MLGMVLQVGTCTCLMQKVLQRASKRICHLHDALPSVGWRAVLALVPVGGFGDSNEQSSLLRHSWVWRYFLLIRVSARLCSCFKSVLNASFTHRSVVLCISHPNPARPSPCPPLFLLITLTISVPGVPQRSGCLHASAGQVVLSTVAVCPVGNTSKLNQGRSFEILEIAKSAVHAHSFSQLLLVGDTILFATDAQSRLSI